MAEANQRMSEVLAAQPDDPTLLMQRGYLHQRMRQPRDAARLPGARHGQAPPTAILDEGYALSGVGDKRGAVDRLKEAIDQDDAGKLDLTPQQRFDTRSSIAGLSREWGGYISTGYRARGRPRPAPGGAAITVPGDAVFSTAEIFWRPSDFPELVHAHLRGRPPVQHVVQQRRQDRQPDRVEPRGGGNIQVDETSNNGTPASDHRGLAGHALHAVHRGRPDLRPGTPVQPGQRHAGRARSRHGPMNCAAH